jgi:hypothetical protein
MKLRGVQKHHAHERHDQRYRSKHSVTAQRYAMDRAAVHWPTLMPPGLTGEIRERLLS